MSKSIKRNNKYFGEDYESRDEFEEHREHLREKRIRAALRSKNINALYEINEEDYY